MGMSRVICWGQKMQIFLRILVTVDQDDVLFGNPKWLENFKEMKQAAIDLLYGLSEVRDGIAF